MRKTILIILILFVLCSCETSQTLEVDIDRDDMPSKWEPGADYHHTWGDPNFIDLDGASELTIGPKDQFLFFRETWNLEKVTVDPRHPKVKSVDGVLYTKSGKTLLLWPAKKVVTKPNDEVKYFNDGCYLNCQEFADDFELPEGTIALGTAVFAGANLDNIKIGKNALTVFEDSFDTICPITVTFESEIVYHSFFQSKSIEKIVFEEGVKEIRENNPTVLSRFFLFGLKEVVFPSTLKKIGNVRFPVHVMVEKYELPSNLVKISEHAFDSCLDICPVILWYPEWLIRKNITVFITSNQVGLDYVTKNRCCWDNEMKQYIIGAKDLLEFNEYHGVATAQAKEYVNALIVLGIQLDELC